MRASARLTAVCMAALAAWSGGPARGQPAPPSWSVEKLPGSDGLPQRLARFYKPVPIQAHPAAPQYKLPLELPKLTNPGFAAKLPAFRDRAVARQATERLRLNGFVVIAAGRADDVGEFYASVEARGLPVFVSSDSLLHLYHVQFDETLRDVEEREFFDDVVAISRFIQAEALRLHSAVEGELKQAAGLLAGYATVPVVLLSRAHFAAEARAALKQVRSWPAGRPHWRTVARLQKPCPELFEVLREETQKHLRDGDLKSALTASLEQYVKAHPVDPNAEAKLIPPFAAEQVRAELDRIDAHGGFQASPLFGYREDYSQYVPRGHYTRSRRLRQYFKAMMWYGRMTFLIRGGGEGVTGLIPLAEARKQTQAACMLAGMMPGKLPDGRSLASAWDRLYAVTAYYVGFADDLTPYEYRGAMREAIGRTVSAGDLADADRLFRLRGRLAALRKPQIYSGLGDVAGPPGPIADEQDLAAALAMTQGLRLMGQRYVPDSYMFGRLVYPTVGTFTGEGEPFTLVPGPGGAIRGFPRGLDVMAVLGSARARQWLAKLGDDRYARYDQTLEQLTRQFAEIDPLGWNRNLYWSWLYALKALLTDYGRGYPAFMRTAAWSDKQLSAALASWSQLRHDTILYAKQSYTMKAMAAPPRKVAGYVEPVPAFYGRLLALTRMSLAGLDEMKVLDARARARLEALEKILARLLAISQSELAGERLTDDDYAFIRGFGRRLKSVVSGARPGGLETPVVADVHTDANTGHVLEEATGYLHPMVVVYPMPDGGLVAGVGPALSQYEFKHPMAERLTDEAWRRMLREGNAPALPKWTETFTVSAAPGGAGKTTRLPQGPGARPGGPRPGAGSRAR